MDWDVVRGNSKSDVVFFVQQTSDGGYVVTGYWEGLNENDTDVFLEKIDSEGNFLWGKWYGTSGHDVGYCVQQTKDGGYIIGGYVEPVGQGGNNFYIIKTDSEGNSLWTKIPDSPEDDACYSIQQTEDGGYILVGYIDLFDEDGKDVHLIKTDSDGNRIWSYAFGGVGEDVGRSVKQTNDGGYIVVGWTSPLGAGDQNVRLFKTDSDGNKQWGISFGIKGNEDAGYSVQQTSDGGYIVVGYTESDTDRDIYLAKIDPYGQLLWGKTHDNSNDDVGRSVWQDVDGGYIITGHTESFEGGKDVYLLKTDSEGNKLWDIVVGGTDDDAGYSVQPTSDGGYIVAGYTGSIDEGEADSYLIKFQPTIIEEVEIGVIFPIEEAQETLGPMVDMAEEDINDYMERNNHSYRFEFLIENAEGQVDVHLEKVQEFKSMGVDLIIGGASSSQAQGSLSYVNQNDMLLLSHGSNNPALGIPDDNLFRLCPTVLYQTRAIAKMLRS